MIKIDHYIEALVKTDLFKGFKKEELKGLLSSAGCLIKKYKKAQIIHLQNEICQTMDIILGGQVAVQKIDKEGDILTVDVFSAPNIIGANLIFSSNNIYPMSIISESDAVILHLSKKLVLDLSQNNLSFMAALLQAVTDRALILANKINTISLKTIRQQIIAFLTYEYHIQKSLVIKLNYSKKDLAERLGIQRTSLSRELNKMRKEGLLEYDSRTITIKNIEVVKG